MTLNSFVKSGLRAGVVVLALGGTALVAATPTQAASPSIGFQLNFGNGDRFDDHGPRGGFGHNDHGRHMDRGGRFDHFRACLSDRDIQFGLRDQGYQNVRVERDLGRNKVFVVGMKRGSWYQLRVDRCTGKVDLVKKIRRSSNGHFSFSFSL